MSDSTTVLPSISPKLKQAFYDAVPHLTDHEDKSKNELRLIRSKEKRHGFLFQDGKSFWHAQPKSGKTSSPKFDAFVAILKTQGQLEPIWVDEEDYVLDGFTRWFAIVHINSKTEIAGEPAIIPIVQVIPNLGDDAAKVSWIRSRKLARHNLTEKQRMKIVTEEIKAHPERSSAWTAKLLGVSPQTVATYRSRLEKAGELSARVELIGSDGRKVSHSAKAPQTKDELAEAQKKEAERKEGKKGAGEGDAADPSLVPIDDPKPVDHDPDQTARSFVKSLGNDKNARNTLTGLLRSLVILMRSCKEKLKEEDVEQHECDQMGDLIDEVYRLLNEIKEELGKASQRSQSVELIP